ncbi:oxidoreductase [Streptomyces sp. ODS05-4]|uniref:oxidoreductase n=1 Tax=Streptomyces sp. ODS05-4 TaxID=2944939 RepID=UPI00210C8229|nr:oxidoreductase [Streptomyces sp. ODS05-4]
MVSYAELSPDERALWDAFPEGRRVELRAGGERGAVRARVIAALLLGHAGPEGRDGAGAVPAVRLAGARVTGRLELAGAELACALHLEDCVIADGVNLTGALTRSICVRESELSGLHAQMARIGGRLDLRGCTVRGRVVLRNARIDGELVLDGAELSHPEGKPLDAGGLEMGGGVWGQHGLVVDGGVRLRGARLPGGLFLDGARLRAAHGTAALQLENAALAALHLGAGFTAEGGVSLRGARVEGEVSFAGAALGEGCTGVDLTRLRATELAFTPAAAPAGPVRLQGCRVEILRDHPDAWPPVVGLQGFVYEWLDPRDDARDGTARRLAWLRREPEYSPQPYEQLAGWYRRVGHDDLARRVLLARQRRRRATLGPLERAWSRLLDVTVGFGYRPQRALLWVLLLTALGTAVFSAGTPKPVKPGEGAPFSPLVYALDLLVPLGNLGQRAAWYWPDGLQRGTAYLLIAAGWLLTTALVAGVTRALSKN